jgi:hypothetical protein
VMCFSVTPSSMSLSGPSSANVGLHDFLYVQNQRVTGTLIFGELSNVEE